MQANPVSVFAVVLFAGCSGGSSSLSRPNAAIQMGDGSLFVTDRTNNRVVRISSEGRVVAENGGIGRSGASLFSAWDMDVDSKQNIYVCNHVASDDGSETVHDGVKVFSQSGEFIKEIGAHDYGKGTEGESRKPYGLFIDSNDRLFVGDLNTATVRVFSKDGTLIQTLFGKNADGTSPFGGIEDLAFDTVHQRLMIVDSGLGSLRVFDTEEKNGQIVVKEPANIWASFGHGKGEISYPYNIDLDSESGEVFVSDMGNMRIVVFDKDGKHSREFGVPEKIWQALGVDWSPSSKTLAVADAFNNTVWIFDRNGKIIRRLGK